MFALFVVSIISNKRSLAFFLNYSSYSPDILITPIATSLQDIYAYVFSKNVNATLYSSTVWILICRSVPESRHEIIWKKRLISGRRRDLFFITWSFSSASNYWSGIYINVYTKILVFILLLIWLYIHLKYKNVNQHYHLGFFNSLIV